MNYPRLFAVVSWGATATHWLFRVLNAHPKIFCFHHLLSSINMTKRLEMNPIEYMTTIAHSGAGFQLAGDVHGIELEWLPKMHARWPDRFRAAIMVRNPVQRVRSAYALWDNKLGVNSGVDILKPDCSQEKGEEADAKERELFTHFMTLINRISEERKYGHIYLMEKLTTDLEELNLLLGHLTEGELKFESDDDLFEHGPGHMKKKDSPEEAFTSLPEWQREMFVQLLTPKARWSYEDLGYDLSFLKQ